MEVYLWARVFDQEKAGDPPLGEGAVRVSAIANQRFEVSDFVSIAEIRARPAVITTVFPRPVCDRIRSIVGESPTVGTTP